MKLGFKWVLSQLPKLSQDLNDRGLQKLYNQAIKNGLQLSKEQMLKAMQFYHISSLQGHTTSQHGMGRIFLLTG
jgi:hypothetical protein